MLLSRGVCAAVLLVMVAACGETTSTPGAGGPTDEPVGAWSTQQLAAEVGADRPPLLGTAGDDALVLAVSEQDTLLSHLSSGGSAFERGEPLATGAEFLELRDVVRLPDGDWFTLGSGGLTGGGNDAELTFEPVAFRSTDGLVWERVEVTGFAHPVQVDDLAVLNGTVVAAGAYRTAADPAMGGFEAHVWTSTDAASFTQVELPGVREPRGYRDDSFAGHLAATGDRLLAAGRVGGSAAVWSSDDGARTWSRATDRDLEDVYAISGLAAVGDVVLAGVGDGAAGALRSTDRGATWAPAGGLPPGGGETAWAPVWGDQHRFWTLTGVDSMSWSRPEVCYADLDQCGRNPAPRVVSSPDGSTWTAVDLPTQPETVAGTGDGRVIVVGMGGPGALVVHTLPSGSAPPEATAAPEPTTVDLVTLGEGERPEPGVRYHAPMYVHCGMGWFWFGDSTWRRTDDGPAADTGGTGGPAPRGWPLVGQTLFGYATLTDADHLEYSTGDEVVATYRREEGAPLCA